MLSIKCVNSTVTSNKANIYIPLCYLLNGFATSFTSSTAKIYIPLCYLLNGNLGKNCTTVHYDLHSTMLSIK